MAENRVTTNAVEVAIERSSVPGDARLTTHAVEVAVLRVDPGGNARVTAQCVEVAILRDSLTSARRGDFFFAR